MANDSVAVPTGTLKQINIKDIKRDSHRFRAEFGDLAALCESIKEKGILQPVTLSPDLHILAGERRIKAAELAGLEKVPALIRKIDGEVDAREIELIENTFRLDFSWQEETGLIAEIDKLYKEKDIAWSGRKTAALLDKGVGSVSRALQLARAIEVLPEIGEQRTADDAFKMLKKFEEQAVIDELRRRQSASIAAAAQDTNAGGEIPAGGMAWDTASHIQTAEANYRIGDTFEGLADLRDAGSIHVIECDPPYGINLGDVKSVSEGDRVETYQEIPAERYVAFLSLLTRELYRVAAQDCWLIFWFGPTWHTEVKASLTSAGWQVDDIPAVWTKRQGQTLQPEIYLARAYEPFFVCRKGNPIMAKRGRLNVFDFSTIPSGKKYHPTERPLDMMRDLLSTLGVPGQIVLVPFLGSGVTLRAAYQQDMRAFGWDSNAEYRDRFLLAVEEDLREATTEVV